jgi:hypothetical protein
MGWYRNMDTMKHVIWEPSLEIKCHTVFVARDIGESKNGIFLDYGHDCIRSSTPVHLSLCM